VLWQLPVAVLVEETVVGRRLDRRHGAHHVLCHGLVLSLRVGLGGRLWNTLALRGLVHWQLAKRKHILLLLVDLVVVCLHEVTLQGEVL
jgi:hypothetical protein